MLGFLVLQIPSTQQNLLDYYTGRLSKASGFKISYTDFYLSWFDNLRINGLKIYDTEQNLMISVEQLAINFKISSIVSNNNINIDGVSLKKSDIYLTTIHDTDSTYDLNINVFIEKLGTSTDSVKNKKSIAVNLGEFVLDQTKFTYHNTQRDSVTNTFDFNHFSIDLATTEVDGFKVSNDTVQFNIASLDAHHKVSGFKVEELSSFFRLTKNSLQLLGLRLETAKSLIQDTVIFKYTSIADLSDFVDKVSIKATIRDSKIHPDDIRLFSGAILPEVISVAGRFSGKVKNFNVQRMDLAIGRTRLSGKLHMDGLPSINETFIDLDVDKGYVNIPDLEFIFPSGIYKRLQPLGRFAMKGKFTGFTTDFVADGDFNGTLGRIISDVNLKINEKNVEQSTYSGNLNLQDVNLGQYFNDSITFQKVTLQGNIAGKGLTFATADFLLKSKIESIGVLGYNYQNITTDAHFASEFFSGSLAINDPNLKLAGSGSVDFRQAHEQINIKAQLDTARLDQLHFSTTPLLAHSTISINAQGLTLNEIQGEASFTNSYVRYGDRSLSLKNLIIKSKKIKEGILFELTNPYVDVAVEGNFLYSSILQDLQKLFRELQLSIRNNRAELDRYYQSKKHIANDYHAKFKINLKNVNPAIELIGLPLSISKSSKIEGTFSNGYTTILNAYAALDSITVKDKLFLNNELELSGSKISDSTNVLAMMTINSKTQHLAKNIVTENLFSEAIWDHDHIDFNLDAFQKETDNFFRLRSEIDFLDDSLKFKILPSQFRLLKKDWVINQKNFTLMKGNEFSIHHLEFHHEDQSILISGRISEDKNQSVHLSLNNLNLDILNTISTEKFSGLINGTVEARDLYQNPYVQNEIAITAFTVNDFLIGDITGTNHWNRDEKRFNIDFHIDRFNQRTVSLKGNYDPENQNPLNLYAKLEKTNIKIVEPFLKGIFSQINGELSGDYTIKGTFSQPQIRGEGKIEDGRIMIDYLKTLYQFSGSLGFTPNQIIFKNFDLTDPLKNKASLDGFLIHRNFGKFRINLDASFRNFQVLNTSPKDNELFYGQAYATGKLNMLGPLVNMKISATARSEKNTRIYIPISGSQSAERKDFVSFISLRDTVKLKSLAQQKKSQAEISGITMDLNLDITPDAYAEIIFDIKAGDIIRGYGNGDIKLQLDTKGEFNMFGLYEFERGNYNFTLYDIINKEFLINKGSRISWYGDPYTGVLNLSASYRQLATLAPILTDQTITSSPQIKRKYPVEVLLKLDGQMLSPQISFDLGAKDLPDNIIVEGRADPVRLNFEFNAFKAKLDEQELKRQVFSLIVLRRFSPPDAFSTSGSLYNSVSEFLSNQLSYWLTQVDQNLEIDLDLGTLDQEAFNTFQLRLSYSFFNGRLRVTRDGTFTNQYNRSDVANMLGDWTVDYLLTPDGKFKVKMYNRSTLNQLNASLGTQAAITTGVSLLHTQNFNRWRELITSARDRRRKELEERQNNEEAILEKEGSQ